jgi:hypothetical protein
MPTSTQELRNFHEYAAVRIANDGAKLDLEDLLDEWKHQSQDSERDPDSSNPRSGPTSAGS